MDREKYLKRMKNIRLSDRKWREIRGRIHSQQTTRIVSVRDHKAGVWRREPIELDYVLVYWHSCGMCDEYIRNRFFEDIRACENCPLNFVHHVCINDPNAAYRLDEYWIVSDEQVPAKHALMMADIKNWREAEEKANKVLDAIRQEYKKEFYQKERQGDAA